MISVFALVAVSRANEAIAPAAAERATAPADWDRSPYRVRIYLRIDAAPGWTAARRKELVAEVANRAAGIVGGVWQVDAAEATAELKWDRASALGQVALDAIPSAAMDGDKVILLGLEQSSERQPTFWARELDMRTRLWSAAIEQAGPSRSATIDDFALAAVHAAWTSFRLFGRIETVADQGATVRIRGGALPAASRAVQLARRGSSWQPIVRHFDAAGRTVKDGVFPIAVTWLRSESIDGATARCSLVTGVQDPLALQYDGRTEYLALGVGGVASTGTDLVCLTSGTPERPMAGLAVLVRDAADKPARVVGKTDSRGMFRLPATGGAGEALTVYLRSGDDLLTRFPLVPGLESSKTIRLDDTGRRPESARVVDAARVELLDLSTQHRLLYARFSRQVDAGQLDDAKHSLAALKTLGSAEQFLASLDKNRAKLTTVLANPTATAWLDKRLLEIKSLAPTTLLRASNMATLENFLASKQQK